ASDFPIDDSAHPEFGMYTRGFFQYRYKDHWTMRNGHAVARVTEWVVWSGFDRNKSSRKSWFTRVEQTLPHEQGHLDINELYSKRFADQSLSDLPTGEGNDEKQAEADLARKMQSLAERV